MYSFARISLISLGLAAAAGAAEDAEFFETRIRPVLVKNCYGCHAGARVSGGLAIDTRDSIRRGGNSGPAVVPGDPAHSLLLKAVKHEGRQMPPGGKLPEAVIADLEKWIEMGAPDPRTGPVMAEWKIDLTAARAEWPYRAPVAVKQFTIDKLINAKLAAKGITTAPPADRATLLRRVTLDLVGLPPTPAEIVAFEKDKSPNAFAKVVDRLLASPHFGERWGRHWLDVARYADSIGRGRNFPFAFAWKYRDWVIDSFNRDLPYNEFVIQQLAGDLLPAANEESRKQQLIATGFLALGSHELNENDAAQYQADVADDMVNATSKAFLGLTVGCARCHNHKFDPIAQADYYAVAGIFKSTELLSGLTPRARDGRSYYKPTAFVKLDQSDGGLAPEIAAKYAELAREHQQAMLDFVKAQRIRPRTNETQREVARARFRLRQVQDQIGALPLPANLAMGVKDAARPVDDRVKLAGDVHQLGPKVDRGVVPVLAAGPVAMPVNASGRLELARWIASRENPLTARVMVNRVWSHLFGQGIVGTVDNFGKMGDRPTHPELLDTLAVRFMEQGWSVKKLVREMVLTQAYQRSSAHVEKSFLADPDNTLLWRMNRQRLEAEAIRDALLKISGRLEPARPEVDPASKLAKSEPIGGVQAQLARRRAQPKAGDAAEQLPYRSVYVPVPRSALPQMFEVFDFPEPSETKGAREVTTVSTQALFLMNNPFVLEAAGRAADQLLADASLKSNLARIQQAYRQVLGRLPGEKEVRASLAFVDQAQSGKGANPARESWSRFYQALFASAEFRYRS